MILSPDTSLLDVDHNVDTFSDTGGFYHGTDRIGHTALLPDALPDTSIGKLKCDNDSLIILFLSHLNLIRRIDKRFSDRFH